VRKEVTDVDGVLRRGRFDAAWTSQRVGRRVFRWVVTTGRAGRHRVTVIGDDGAGPAGSDRRGAAQSQRRDHRSE